MKKKKHLRQLKEFRKLGNLKGIEGMFSVLEKSGHFEIDQGIGRFKATRFRKESKSCSGCVFSFLAWFFKHKDKKGYYEYTSGETALAEYLGMPADEMLYVVGKLAGNPFPTGPGFWNTKPSKVFKKLRKQYPGK